MVCVIRGGGGGGGGPSHSDINFVSWNFVQHHHGGRG